MSRIITSILMLTFAIGFAQSNIEGYIFDKNSKEPLAFATIKIISNKTYYTITNEDGKFEIDSKFSQDDIEISNVGYEKTKVALSYFKDNQKLYLNPFVSELDEVILTGEKDEEYAYVLFDKLIDKCRKNKNRMHSKAFLSLTSSARNIPIEQIEGFYNSEQSLADGVINLKVKSGRFGQNKLFPFYSLDNTRILSDFQFFETGNQILPLYPGNMTTSAIKRNYIVKIEQCTMCNDNDAILSFAPKKDNGRLFRGSMLFNYVDLRVKKIELQIKNPVTKSLTSINSNVTITPNEIQLKIAFNPIDLEKIQYIDFSFRMDYKAKTVSEIIESNSFIYFYDYNSSFEEPYFIPSILFNNDYDRMIALKTSDDFWNTNYQFPKSINEKRSMAFMEKNGFLFNYDNAIAVNDIQYTKPAVISWQSDQRLEWDFIKKDLSLDDNTQFKNRNFDTERKADKVYYSSSEVLKNYLTWTDSEAYNFNYMLDVYTNTQGEKQYISRTLMDRNSSFFKYDRTKNKLIYINIIFDIYEVFRQGAAIKIANHMTLDDIKNLYTTAYDEASLSVKNFAMETSNGLDYQNLLRWNNKIKSKLKVDNFLLVH